MKKFRKGTKRALKHYAKTRVNRYRSFARRALGGNPFRSEPEWIKWKGTWYDNR